MMLTEEERRLLARMEAGELDGRVSEPKLFERTVGWLVIEGGIPKRYERDLDDGFFDGRDESCGKDRKLIREWVTEEERILFLRERGAGCAADKEARLYC